MTSQILVWTNVPDAAIASTIANAIVEQRVGACVNILPGVQSIYRWQGKIATATEMMLLIKTTKAHYVALEKLIVALHPYEVPEIIAVPVTAGLPAYVKWIESETKKDGHV